MGHSVKYQIGKAEQALRSALELGAMHEDPYTLHSIVEALQKLGYIIIMEKCQPPKEEFKVEGIPFSRNYTDTITFGGINPNPDINFIT